MNFSIKSKKITLALALALTLTTAHAATSNIAYQGVAFNNSGAVASTNIALRFTIYQSDGTTVVYQETKSSVTTTDKGYFSHQIGSGTRTAGAANYGDIVWADGYKLKFEVDYANGTNYTDLGTQEFSSSVYALKAKTADTATTLSGLTSTVAELNYVDGVTSNIQTQLNEKSATSHTHSYLPTSGGTITGGVRINGTASQTISEFRILSHDIAASALSPTATTNFALYAENRIGAVEFNAFSDKRIKEDIHPIANSLETIKKLKPSVYKKIDKLQFGDGLHYGFIAQEVEEVIPEAITKGKGEVPVLKKFDEVTFEDGVEYKIVVKNDDNNVTQQEYNTTMPRPQGEVVVVSKKVDDFHTVDYNMIFTQAVAAIKEQQKMIENLQNKLQKLNTEIEVLKSQQKSK